MFTTAEFLQDCERSCVSVFRLVEEQGGELAVDQLNKDLKTLAKQAKATKYTEVMKLLRLALSGLQVPDDIMHIVSHPQVFSINR